MTNILSQLSRLLTERLAEFETARVSEGLVTMW